MCTHWWRGRYWCISSRRGRGATGVPRAQGATEGSALARLNQSVRSPELSVLPACEHVLQQRPKFLVRQGRKLQQAGVQPLELAFGHRVEVHAANALLGTRALQPTKENLGGTGIRDCALSQASLDFCVRRRFTITARCPAPSPQRSAR